jgi:hypothetical protein
MKYKREDRVKILEYKFIFEEELQVKKEYEEGTADLNYRLSFFRNKLDMQKGVKGQKDLYDKMFMGHIPKDDGTDIIVSESDTSELTQSASRAKDDIKPWAKKVYRKIVMVTHPDKTSEIQSKHLKEQLTSQYRITQNAYNNELYSDLIMVAFDLNILVPEEVVAEEITPSSNKKKKKIGNIKKLLGWQWFHVPESQRDAELKKILVRYGFKFTEEEVTAVVGRKYVKRKPGTRPEKINVKRRRLK